MQAIKAIDYYLLPVYILLAILIIRGLRKKLNPDKSTYKLYYWAFIAKLLGALLSAFIIQYYYGYGDSLTYFDEARILHDQVLHNFSNVKYFFSSVEQYKNLYDPAINTSWISQYNDSNLVIIRIAALFNFFSFNTYLTTTVFFVLLSFSGMWAIYLTFISIAPALKKQFAWGILYLPSVIFWSSGIMKDTLTIAALGWLFFCYYKYFILKDKRMIFLVISLICIYLIFVVKFYIITAFAIAFIFTGILYVIFKLRPLSKRIIFSTILIALILIMILTDNSVSEFISKFSVDIVVDNIERMQKLYLENNTVDEGNFSIGKFDPSIGGIMAKMPIAIETVLYRPFIWESRKIIMIFSGLENLILMLLTIYVIVRAGIINFFRIIAENSLVQFCIFFTIIFSIIVGLTTFNFGTMLRYKVPCMPFYTSFLILINYYAAKRKKSKIIILQEVQTA